MRDLHELPKLRDSISYAYVEKAIIDRKQHAIEAVCDRGRIPIPIASLCLLLLGPGTSITHAAIKTLADNGCSVLWVGEDATRFYAYGTGETRKAYRLLRQAALVCDAKSRQAVVLRMYKMRFGGELDPDLSLPQIRGKEGVRVREAYKRVSQQFNVPWHGRRYDRGQWNRADPINRALSAANALLNGTCHAAIVSSGYSPGLGFVHTGKQLSFVYDIADLYKVDLTVPIAFEIVSESSEKVEARARQMCRERFKERRLLNHIITDIDNVLNIDPVRDMVTQEIDEDGALPTALWEPLQGEGD